MERGIKGGYEDNVEKDNTIVPGAARIILNSKCGLQHPDIQHI